MVVWDFFKALCKYWWALTSSAIFTAIGVYAAWRGKTSQWVVAASVAAALISFIVAAYFAWEEKRQKLEEEIAKRGRPELTIDFKNDPNENGELWCRLSNATDNPAINIHVSDINFEDGYRVFRYEPPPKVVKGCDQIGRWHIVCPFVLYNIRQDFEHKPQPGDASSTHVFEVHFSDIEAKRTWHLHCQFNYLYRARKFHLIKQFMSGPY